LGLLYFAKSFYLRLPHLYFMKTLVKVWALALILGSCGGAKEVQIQTLRPADITVAPVIQTLLLVDRTHVDRNDWLAIGEGILTGELPYEDRAAAQEALNALKNKLQESPRFQIKIARERLKGNSLSSAFPDPLPWDEQRRLLQRYQADALISIEIMDSDFIITRGKRKVTEEIERNNQTVEVERDEFYAEGVANIKMGFRLYYPGNRQIIDQQLINETRTWQSAARSKAEAAAQLISKSRATQVLCAQAGTDYAFKLAPLPIALKRTFYTKSKKSVALEQGARMAEVDDWTNAISTWKKGIENAVEPKDQGRMALNIAVGYEVLGQFENARAWAQKAYVQYGNKQAKGYLDRLMHRIEQENRVEVQMQKE